MLMAPQVFCFRKGSRRLNAFAVWWMCLLTACWGVMPSLSFTLADLPNLKPESKIIVERNSDLQGSIPPELGRFTKLECLTFEGKNISGSIPPELGNLVQLKWLILRGTNLSGPIPPSLGTGITLPAYARAVICTSDYSVTTDKGELCGYDESCGPAGDNLCRNFEAVIVVSVLVGSALAAAILGNVSIVLWFQCGRHSGRQAKQSLPLALTVAIYLWGIICAAMPIADLATDLVVLKAVWGQWPMWVILGSVLLPFFCSGVIVVWGLSGKKGWVGALVKEWPPRFFWSPRLVALGTRSPLRPAVEKGFPWMVRGMVTILFSPLGMAAVPLLDLLGLAERCGLCLEADQDVISSDGYIAGRSYLDTFLRSLPQAVLQSIVYIARPMPANAIYIDSSIYIPSVTLSLLSMVVQSLQLTWSSLSERKACLPSMLTQPGKIVSSISLHMNSGVEDAPPTMELESSGMNS